MIDIKYVLGRGQEAGTVLEPFNNSLRFFILMNKRPKKFPLLHAWRVLIFVDLFEEDDIAYYSINSR